MMLCMQVGNLAYMCRLGLWGPGSAFKDFEVRVLNSICVLCALRFLFPV